MIIIMTHESLHSDHLAMQGALMTYALASVDKTDNRNFKRAG